MKAFLGIDHPLILVRDIESVIERYRALGFTMTPVGKHPWGTSTSVALFGHSALELMGVYDKSLIGGYGAGDFYFGRHVRDHLSEREGVAMLALRSDDSEGDTAEVAARGITCDGAIEFGRDVVLPDGQHDRTRTTLKVFSAPEFPRLTNFSVEQHRPDLIYVGEWMQHQNKVIDICKMTILAQPEKHAALRTRLGGLYGEDALFTSPGGFGVKTGNGTVEVVDGPTAADLFPELPVALADSQAPFYLGIDMLVERLSDVIPILEQAGVPYRATEQGIKLTDASYYGNVFLGFVAQQ